MVFTELRVLIEFRNFFKAMLCASNSNRRQDGRHNGLFAKTKTCLHWTINILVNLISLKNFFYQNEFIFKQIMLAELAN